MACKKNSKKKKLIYGFTPTNYLQDVQETQGQVGCFA